MRCYDQYYAIAVAAVLFYDFFLTLADEVSISLPFPFTKLTIPPVTDRVRLEREEIMGSVRRIICRTALVDDLIVFAVFVAVCPPPQQSTAFLNRLRRTDISR